MATSTTTQTRRRNGGSADDAMEFGMEATRNAQETLMRSMRTGVDTALTFADVGQRVTRELMTLTVTGAKQMLQMWAEMQGSMLDALQSGMAPWAEGSPAFRGWQRIVDGSAHAVNRFAETMQGTAEEGTERIKQAVGVMADQIKEGTAQLGQTVENETNRTRAAASRS
jgi:gas vesicle protein